MKLTNDELTVLLDRLLAGWENDVVEFKEAARQFSADKTGEYVSALSNEANLRGFASGWLGFGVSNARQVVCTTHLVEVQQRQALKHHSHHQSIEQGLSVREANEVMHPGKRVGLLEVPAASASTSPRAPTVLNEALTEQQKATKITNLLTKLRRQGLIINRGSRTQPRWELAYAGDGDAQAEPNHKKKEDSGDAREQEQA